MCTVGASFAYDQLVARERKRLISWFTHASRYGFAIGNVAAFDMSNDEAIVSPGGVGFGTSACDIFSLYSCWIFTAFVSVADINCGVRLVRTNLHYKDVEDKKEEIAQTLFNHIPVGVGM